jgi:uncharacterized protein YvpB
MCVVLYSSHILTLITVFRLLVLVRTVRSDWKCMTMVIVIINYIHYYIVYVKYITYMRIRRKQDVVLTPFKREKKYQMILNVMLY